MFSRKPSSGPTAASVLAGGKIVLVTGEETVGVDNGGGTSSLQRVPTRTWMRESPYGSLRTLSDAEVKVIKESKDPALMAEVDRAVEEAEAGLRKLKEDRDRAEQEEREREEMLRRERDAVYKAERERQEAAQRQAQEDERLRLEAIAQEKAALYVDNAFGQF